MNEILKKLNLKNLTDFRLILNAPKEYLEIFLNDNISLDANIQKNKYQFIQVFGISNYEIKESASKVIDYLDDDGLLWLCYPKKTSKKYKGSDCDRDKVASLLAEFNFEPVRQVAIDDDFSALRFRHVSNIKTMVRKSAETEAGKKRIENNNL
ncbi:MAG: hypothetical protein K0Q49_670 [Haloplasmataceae bacterium]|jgi:hypothetical protein|nr:hypothetical protein [Haloplasmataceae bacterium]